MGQTAAKTEPLFLTPQFAQPQAQSLVGSLPSDVLRLVLRHLGTRTLLQARLVCKHWKWLLTDAPVHLVVGGKATANTIKCLFFMFGKAASLTMAFAASQEAFDAAGQMVRSRGVALIVPVAQRDPHAFQTGFQTGIKLAKAKLPAHALKHFEYTMKIRPQTADVGWRIAAIKSSYPHLRGDAADIDRCIQYLDAGIARITRPVNRPYVLRGMKIRFLIDLQRYDEALLAIDQLLAVSGTSVLARALTHVLRAEVFVAKGLIPEALAQFAAARAIFDFSGFKSHTREMAFRVEGEALMRANRFEDACRVYSAALADKPSFAMEEKLAEARRSLSQVEAS